MPPTQLPAPIIDTDHLLPPARKKPVGSIVGIAIIVFLMIVGALYFWGAHLNKPAARTVPAPMSAAK